MQRDGNDQVEMLATQPRVIQVFAEPGGERVTEMTLPPVFEFVDELANDPATPVGRDGRIEMQNAVLAIGATECLRDRAGKGLRTFRAERRGDPRRSAVAILAQVFRALDFSGAHGAGRRIEERTQRGEGIKLGERPHISTKL
jgi:hypothetical protein